MAALAPDAADMSGAEAAIERLAIKAERIALARSETLARRPENRNDRADARMLRRPVTT